MVFIFRTRKLLFCQRYKNNRAFVEKDIQVLEQMKNLIQEAGMSIESAVKVVLSAPCIKIKRIMFQKKRLKKSW
ncbi:MerR family transcriptional regulator [Bacillus cereus]|nr:MerR family transcriptional regulator [Bacillus cereus]MDR4987075.1 MerR family transcriptional regulator [Bacillus cereus]